MVKMHHHHNKRKWTIVNMTTTTIFIIVITIFQITLTDASSVLQTNVSNKNSTTIKPYYNEVNMNSKEPPHLIKPTNFQKFANTLPEVSINLRNNRHNRKYKGSSQLAAELQRSKYEPTNCIQQLKTKSTKESDNVSFDEDSNEDATLIHKPADIYVDQQPTHVVISHPDIVIHPAPIIFHKPAAVVPLPPSRRRNTIKPSPAPLPQPDDSLTKFNNFELKTENKLKSPSSSFPFCHNQQLDLVAPPLKPIAANSPSLNEKYEEYQQIQQIKGQKIFPNKNIDDDRPIEFDLPPPVRFHSDKHKENINHRKNSQYQPPHRQQAKVLVKNTPMPPTSPSPRSPPLKQLDSDIVGSGVTIEQGRKYADVSMFSTANTVKNPMLKESTAKKVDQQQQQTRNDKLHQDKIEEKLKTDLVEKLERTFEKLDRDKFEQDKQIEEEKYRKQEEREEKQKRIQIARQQKYEKRHNLQMRQDAQKRRQLHQFKSRLQKEAQRSARVKEQMFRKHLQNELRKRHKLYVEKEKAKQAMDRQKQQQQLEKFLIEKQNKRDEERRQKFAKENIRDQVIKMLPNRYNNNCQRNSQQTFRRNNMMREINERISQRLRNNNNNNNYNNNIRSMRNFGHGNNNETPGRGPVQNGAHSQELFAYPLNGAQDQIEVLNDHEAREKPPGDVLEFNENPNNEYVIDECKLNNANLQLHQLQSGSPADYIKKRK